MTNLDIEQENKELRASIETLKKAYAYYCVTDLKEILEKAFNQSPAQNLNDMKADAILSLKNSGVGFSVQCSEFDQEWVYSHDDIDNHADNVRKGEI